MNISEHLLATHLDFAVPLFVAEMKANGGPSEADWSAARGLPTRLGAQGDVMLYGGKGAGELANETAHAVAVLSFCPGGIKLLGRRWENTL